MPNRNHKGAGASIGVALIARDAAETLPRCLASIRPYVRQIVVGLDTLTTDSTRKAAHRAGADTVFQLQVSDWHECPRHGRVLAQDFARARNESFARLDKRLDWLMWIDADDYVVGAEKLAELVAAVPAQCCGLWLPYHYATLNEGSVTNTLFDRERILRASLPWHWEHRVHEVVAPGALSPQWIRSDAVRVYHQEGGHKSQDSAARNLLLLEIDLEEKPNDPRTLFYIGNQHFAMGSWHQAAGWYERLTETGDQNPYQLWQAYCYMSLAYERLGDLDSALKAAFAAIDVRPEHPEPYLRLAAIYSLSGDHEKALYWTAEGRRRPEPPFFVFKNPLDYTFNSRMVAADALANLGRIKEARQELEAAAGAMETPKVRETIDHYRGLERAAELATGFVRLADGKSDAEVIQLWEMLDYPENVRQFGRCRAVAIPAYLRQRPNTQPRIVLWCGRAAEEWCPATLDKTGIGGSETAVVQIARRFAADGWRADVYNGAGRFEGIYDGVGYFDPERYHRNENPDVLVAWRHPDINAEWQARLKLLWCHDLHYGPQATSDFQRWAAAPGCRILGVSAWHSHMLERYYQIQGVDFVPNGVELARFAERPKRVPFQCIYASSPDRGLKRLLHLWPALSRDEPGARLKIAYGWENVDKRIAMGSPETAAFKAEIVDLIERTPQVEWCGRLPQDQLARLYGESSAWLYPTDFLEVSCISAMEAMAAGCVPVTSSFGALGETIGSAGMLVSGFVLGQPWKEFYVHVARAVLSNPDIRRPLQIAGRERAGDLTWDRAYERWRAIIAGDLAATRPREALQRSTELAAVTELAGVV